MGRIADSVADDAPAVAPGSRKARLRTALGVTLTVFVVEAVGGFLSGSLALVADANHMLADVAALTLAYAATALAGRAPTSRHTFGLARAEVLAAFVNAQLLLLVCGWLIFETIRRVRNPAEIQTGLMIPVAVVGLIANLISLKVLAPDRRRSLNVRAAYLELLVDAAASLAVIVAGVAIAGTGWTWLDLVVSGSIALLVVPRAAVLLRQSAHILLEGAPREIDLGSVREQILAIPGVEEAHDLHFWTLSSGLHSASIHICTSAESARGRILSDVQTLLKEKAGVEHATIQVEIGPERGCRAAPEHA